MTLAMAIPWDLAKDYFRIGVEFTLILLTVYWILYSFRGTRAINALIGILIFLIVLQFFANAVNMSVIGWLLDRFASVFAIALIVIFQPELRRVLAQVGSRISIRNVQQKEVIEEISSAVTQMSFRRCGALIVFEGKIGLAAIINNAVHLNCEVNSLLVQSLFYPNSPLHDGAVIIRENKIAAAHAILPLSMDTTTRNIGTRHRAAIGVTEETDAIAVIVSEETGLISAAFHGILTRDLSEADLLIYLKEKLTEIGSSPFVKDETAAQGENNE